MRQPLRVLIVEDNPLDAQLVLLALQRAGLEPDWRRVDSESEFLEKLHSGWDIILSDYQMPGFGGLRALALLNASKLDIPFIVISGTIGEDDAVATMKLGAADYLLKDRLGRLGPAVVQAIEQSTLRRQRKAALESMRESDERFRQVVQNIEEVFWMTNIEKTEILFVSSTYDTIWGRTCASLYASPMSWAEAIHPDDREATIKAWSDVSWANPAGKASIGATAAQSEDGFKVEYRIVRPDGSIRWISDRAVPVRNAAGVIYRVAGVATDITDRKQAENDLRNSEDRFRKYFELGLIGMAITSPEKGYVEVNDETCRMFGYERTELMKKTWSELTHPDDLDDSIANFNRVMSGEIDGYTMEKRFIRKDGQSVYANLSIKCLRNPDQSARYFVALMQDITAAKKSEMDLRNSEKQLSLITNNTPGLIAYMDRDLRYRFVNDTYLKSFDMTREEILRRSLRDLLGEATFAHVEPHVKRALAGESVTFESNRIDQAGKTLFAIVTYVPDKSRDGEVRGLFSFVTDVTHLKRTEEALRKSEELLNQAQKMDAIGQLAGGVAHDFNNQLSVIMGYAEILMQQAEQPKVRRFVENIAVAAKRSAELTQKLLVFARKGQIETAPVDLHTVILDTMEMLERTVDKRIVLIKNLKADSAIMIGNSSQLQSALLNLGINARDAMPDGGTLTYETECVTLDDAFCKSHHFEINRGRFIKTVVCDTGCGMSDDVKKHLFEPFFTTKSIGKGTGLGLASVYGTVKQHEGVVTVDSAPGHGSQFAIYLPLADAPEDDVDSLPLDLDAATPYRLLVVEDENILRELIVEFLRDIGHTVHDAENGAVAVAFYEKNWREIDLVILDMIMPEMNGRQTFQALKKINPDIIAVLSTGYSHNADVQSILADGVRTFIQKPFEQLKLQQTIADVMKK